jgi:LAS superfamily LD-carboxypeptidase LdcB
VSLPGASDHNRIERLGLDFVTEDGVDLRYSDPAAFRARAEYRWLVDHAARFGFEGEGADSASPWHWHYAGQRGASFTQAAASTRSECRRDLE